MGLKAATVLSVIAAIPAYLLLGVVFGLIGREELAFLPAGGKIAAILKKVKLLNN
jgi:hypothetical protein